MATACDTSLSCPVVRFSILLVGGAEASLSVIQQTMEFSQLRPYSFLLRSRCRRRVQGIVCQQHVHDSCRGSRQPQPLSQPQPRRPPRCPWQGHLTCCPPTDETDIHNQTGNLGCSSRVASREEPNLCCTKRTPDHTLACSGACQNMERKCVGQADNLSVNRKGLCEYPHMQQRLHEVCTRTVTTVANYCTCRIAMLCRCRCDAEPGCARGQVNTQPTADSADNFTPWTRTLGHTCVNYMTVGAVFDCTPPSPCVHSGPLSRAIEGGHVREPS